MPLGKTPKAMLFEYLLLFSTSLILVNLSLPFSSHGGIQESKLKSQTDSIMIENWSFMILFESHRHLTDTFSDQKVEELKNHFGAISCIQCSIFNLFAVNFYAKNKRIDKYFYKLN